MHAASGQLLLSGLREKPVRKVVQGDTLPNNKPDHEAASCAAALL